MHLLYLFVLTILSCTYYTFLYLVYLLVHILILVLTILTCTYTNTCIYYTCLHTFNASPVDATSCLCVHTQIINLCSDHRNKIILQMSVSAVFCWQTGSKRFSFSALRLCGMDSVFVSAWLFLLSNLMSYILYVSVF